MTPSDEYFAGFFDGEGCVGISPPNGRTTHYLLTAQVTNTNVEILRLFQARFGGKVNGPYRHDDRRKPVCVWSCDARKAEAFLRAVGPFLVVKRAQVELALEFRETFTPENALARGREAHLPKSVEKRTRIMALRADCYGRMRTLNRRGIA